jgi:hypothetical protein
MAQGIYDLLEETLRLTRRLNIKLSTGNSYTTTTTTIPLTTTTSSTSTTSTSTSTSTTTLSQPTTTTTTSINTTRRFWGTDVLFAGRNMFVPNATAFYSGNTVANITATNPDLILMDVNGSSVLRSGSFNSTRIISENISTPFTTITPNYTFNDGNGVSIMRSFKELYAFVNKIVNTSFLATRNPQIVIKRVSQSIGFIAQPGDAFFLIGVDFDATGLERDGYSFTFRAYDQVNIPGTMNTANFTYASQVTSFSSSGNNVQMTLLTPSTSWVDNSTVLYGTYTVREDFPIPPGW